MARKSVIDDKYSSLSYRIEHRLVYRKGWKVADDDVDDDIDAASAGSGDDDDGGGVESANVSFKVRSNRR